MQIARIIFLSFLSAFTIACQGQPNDAGMPANMDDTNRILQLNEKARIFYMENMVDSSLASSSLALQLSENLIETIKDPKDIFYLNRCRSLKAMSLKYIARGIQHTDSKQALDTLQVAIGILQQTGDKNILASIYSTMGLMYDENYRSVKAIEYHRKSLELYRETGNVEAQADQLLNLGISIRYSGNYGDALENIMESLKISRQINDSSTMVEALLAIGFVYLFVEKYEDAIKTQQEALEIYKQQNDSTGVARIYNDMGVTNMNAGKLEIALEQHKAALDIRLRTTDYFYTSASYFYIGNIYEELKMFPEAIENYEAALHFTTLDGIKVRIINSHLDLGSAYLKNSEPGKALEQFMTVLELSREENSRLTEARAEMNIAKIYLEKDQPQKAIVWLKKAEKAAPKPFPVQVNDLYLNLAEAYANIADYKNAYVYLQLHSQVKDSVLVAENIEKITTLSNRLEFENKLELQNESHEKMLALNLAQIKRQKMTKYFSLSGMFVAFILVGIVFVRFIEKNKLNGKLNNTLADLKATQSQLIHAEKMASLGELTAGIAHEIQNPLNFVNNFSEVSVDLIEDMCEEIEKENSGEVKAIAGDLKQNLEKISHHGKRASGIVKGMLEHSRKHSGEKVPTDINALADEYIRLAYHGLRAKDKSFNADFKTELDASLPMMNVISQDIGRVMLNLINNAFYAVSARAGAKADSEYKPLVIVSTHLLKSPSGDLAVTISIKDNGDGIPPGLLEKIFQPFFTTKPTGQGTGLGLSLSYDIIKAHGGDMKVLTKEGEGTEFIIRLDV